MRHSLCLAAFRQLRWTLRGAKHHAAAAKHNWRICDCCWGQTGTSKPCPSRLIFHHPSRIPSTHMQPVICCYHAPAKQSSGLQLQPTTPPEDLPFEAILVRGEADASKPAPLVLYPHGGPHSAYPDGFFPTVAFLCHLGFSVLLVNFRSAAFSPDICTCPLAWCMMGRLAGACAATILHLCAFRGTHQVRWLNPGRSLHPSLYYVWAQLPKDVNAVNMPKAGVSCGPCLIHALACSVAESSGVRNELGLHAPQLFLPAGAP